MHSQCRTLATSVVGIKENNCRLYLTNNVYYTDILESA